MQLNPYVLYNGTCEAAFEFYARVLGGKVTNIHRWAGSPAEKHAPPDWSNKLLHASLEFDGGILMGSDPPPQMYQPPAGISVSIQLKDAAEAERIFNALAENGSIKMPFQKTFFSKGFGQLVDQFQVPWMINVE